MEAFILDEDEERLAPAVVVATIALLGLFAFAFLLQIVRFLL